MNEIEKKALALVNEVSAESCVAPYWGLPNNEITKALCRAIEQREADKAAHAATIEGILKAHEAYKQDVSDAVEHCRACSDPEAWTRIKFELERFIITKPDPLQDILLEEYGHVSADADAFRAALAKRGLKIVETGQ